MLTKTLLALSLITSGTAITNYNLFPKPETTQISQNITQKPTREIKTIAHNITITLERKIKLTAVCRYIQYHVLTLASIAISLDLYSY